MEFPETLKVLQELFAFEHVFFDICLTYIGMLLAAPFSLYSAVLITVAFTSARSAGMLLNRYKGRSVDLLNGKKAGRASMRISKPTLLAFSIISSIVFLASAYSLNLLSLALAPLVILLVATDPSLKRYTKHRHFSVGVILGMTIFGGYIGASGHFPMEPGPYLLFLAVMFIATGSDIIYTLNHTEFDRAHDLKTYPAAYGFRRATTYSLYFHAFGGFLLALFALSLHSAVVLAAAIASAALLLLQHRSMNYGNSKFIAYGFANYKTYVGIMMLLSIAISMH